LLKDRDGVLLTISEIRGQYLEFCAGARHPYLVDAVSKMSRTAIGQVVAIDACDY
jgi:hypothetical protein